MGSIDFLEQNEFHTQTQTILQERGSSGMNDFLVRTGLAKDNRQAAGILIAIAVASLGLTALILYQTNKPKNRLIVDVQGRTYTQQEYIQLVRQGKEPILPQIR